MRDRDRIVHSAAFRRLIYKTQVFVYHEGDQYRTRLTHSLEVAQIARTLARVLRLDEDLVEAVALAHDLGHTPFGHAGEDALDAAMDSIGGFDHNAQSLRIVTKLERRYAAFQGLNLTWETLESIVKHNGPLIGADGKPLKKYAVKGLPQALRNYAQVQDLRLDSFCALEGQTAAISDDIAYNNHDIDDGFRAGYITVKALEEVPLAGRTIAAVRARHGGLPDGPLVYETNRRMISAMVEDVLAETRARLGALNPLSVEDVRQAGTPIAAFSERMAADIALLREFLFAHLYKHPEILKIMGRAQGIVAALYRHYSENPETMPAEWLGETDLSDPVLKGRLAGDYVASMTDRAALKAHAELFELKEFPLKYAL
jgi:dGTPase